MFIIGWMLVKKKKKKILIPEMTRRGLDGHFDTRNGGPLGLRLGFQ